VLEAEAERAEAQARVDAYLEQKSLQASQHQHQRLPRAGKPTASAEPELHRVGGGGKAVQGAAMLTSPQSQLLADHLIQARYRTVTHC